MNRLIPIIIGGVIVIGGAAAIIVTRGDDAPVSVTGGSTQNTTIDGFNAVSTDGLSFVATMTATRDGKTVESLFESDAKTDAVRYAADKNNASFTMIYTKDAYYMCQAAAGSCFKYSLGEGSGANFDPSTYQYDEAKINDYKQTATKLGREDCPAGTCDVWKVTSDNSEAKIYIDVETRRVSQVITTADGIESKLVYEYKDVSVEIPTNAQELPSIPTPTQ